jgi:prolyl 4-hydroxylase
MQGLPGSDPAYLARIGDETRARLDATPGTVRLTDDRLDLYQVRNFLGAVACARMIALVDADAQPSTVFTAATGRPLRTSHTCRMNAADPQVAEVEAAITGLLGLPHSETIQGQRYRPGDYFVVHNDYFAAGQPYSEAVAAEGGQRTWTAMIFLNEPEAGGRTHFAELGLHITPRTGTLLAWNNLGRDGLPNRWSHHEGMPVEAGEKYVLTKWFREREWTPGAAIVHRR